MENEKQFYVLHRSDCEPRLSVESGDPTKGHEPDRELTAEEKLTRVSETMTVRPVDSEPPRLASVLNFENPEDPAVTLREAMAEVYIGAGVAISLTPDESGVIFTKAEVDRLFASPDNSDIQLTLRFRNPDGSWHPWIERTFTEEASASPEPKKKRSAALSRMPRALGVASSALVNEEEYRMMLVRDIRDIYYARDFDRLPCVVLYQDLRRQPHERWLRFSDNRLGSTIRDLLDLDSTTLHLSKGRREESPVDFADYTEKYHNEDSLKSFVRGFYFSQFEQWIEKLLAGETPRPVAVCSMDRGTCSAWRLKRNKS